MIRHEETRASKHAINLKDNKKKKKDYMYVSILTTKSSLASAALLIATVRFCIHAR